MDAHSVIPPGYLDRAVQILIDTGADVVGGMQVPVGRTAWEKAIAAAMSSRLGAGDARYRIGGKPGRADTVYLGVFRKSTLERLGGYDEHFDRNQDYELNQRIRDSGGIGLVRSRTGSRLSTAGIAGRPRPSVLRLWTLEAGIRTSSSRVAAATSAGATSPRRRARHFDHRRRVVAVGLACCWGLPARSGAVRPEPAREHRLWRLAHTSGPGSDALELGSRVPPWPAKPR